MRGLAVYAGVCSVAEIALALYFWPSIPAGIIAACAVLTAGFAGFFFAQRRSA